MKHDLRIDLGKCKLTLIHEIQEYILLSRKRFPQLKFPCIKPQQVGWASGPHNNGVKKGKPGVNMTSFNEDIQNLH